MALMEMLVTVKATGRRYFLRHQTDVGTDRQKVHCWGELASFRGLSSRHEPDGPVFARRGGEIEIQQVRRTPELLRELFEQMLAVKEEAGWEVRRTRRGNATLVSPAVQAFNKLVGGAVR